MQLMRWVTLRSLYTRPLRTVLSVFGIILGVAALLAIRITNSTALDSLSALFETTAGKTDFVVTAVGNDEPGVPERILHLLEDNPQVQAAVPSLQLRTALLTQTSASTAPFSLLGLDLGGVLILGIDPQLDPAARDYTLSRGVFLEPGSTARDLVLVENYAQENDLQVGDLVELLAPDGPLEFEVVGLIAKKGAGQSNNGAFGVIPLKTAQELFNRTGELDQVDIVLHTGSPSTDALDQVKAGLQSQVGESYAITSAAAQDERVNQMLSGFSIGLNFMGGMALFVGGYLIYNAFSMTVVERTREFGILRTLGFTNRQVTFQVLVEAALLGIGGSLLGVVAGLGMAQAAAQLLALLLDLEPVPLKAGSAEILSSLGVGLGVTLVAAMIPAWQAGRISPLEALRVRGVRPQGRLVRHGWMLGVLLLLAAFAILVANPFPYDAQFRLGSLTVVFLFIGATLLIPGIVSAWEVLVRPLLHRMYGAAGRLGSGNIQRSKLRTTLTVAALMVGTSMIIITRGMTDSFRGDLEVWIDAYIGGDLMVTSSTPMRAQVMRRLQAMPGVEAVTPMRSIEVTWLQPGGADETLIFTGVDLETYTQVTSFVFSDSQADVQAAYRQFMDGEALFISSVMAEKYGLRPGDSLYLRTRAGEREFKVAAVVVNFFNQGLAVQGSWQDMRRYFNISDASAYLLQVAGGFKVPAVQHEIETTLGDRENLSVVSNQSLIEQALTLLNQAYSMFDGMALIAMFVGALGIVNTLTMNIVERAQEIGMLRSIGMTRSQVLRMVLAESLLMGLIGGILGLGFGILLTRIFLLSMTAMSGYKITFVMPLQAITAGLAIALVVSQVAAILPARRAANTPILEAIHYE